MTNVKGPICIVPAQCPKCQSLDTRCYTSKGMKGWAEVGGRLYKQTLQFRKCDDCGEGFKIPAVLTNRSRAKQSSAH
jgi:transcriptional regulator NrdR family protein